MAAVLLITGCSLFEDEAQKKVKYFLKDPKSAEFRNTKKAKTPNSPTNLSFCGEVNSKNAYGAFPGFERYIVDGRLVMLERNGEAFYDQMDGESDAERVVRNSGILAAKMRFNLYKTKADLANLLAKEARKKAGMETDTSEAITPFDVMWKDYCE